MPQKKDPIPDVITLAAASAAITLICAFHYQKLKAQYLATENAHRIFDMQANWVRFVSLGSAMFFSLLLPVFMWDKSVWLSLISLPVTYYVVKFSVKAMAHTMLGVVIDHDKGMVFFPPNQHNLAIEDYFNIKKLFRVFTEIDEVAIGDIQRITRQAGKRVILLGDFGSRRIDFSDKSMRDECIHWITSYQGASDIGLDQDVEYT